MHALLCVHLADKALAHRSGARVWARLPSAVHRRLVLDCALPVAAEVPALPRIRAQAARAAETSSKRTPRILQRLETPDAEALAAARAGCTAGGAGAGERRGAARRAWPTPATQGAFALPVAAAVLTGPHSSLMRSSLRGF